jgi:hypothetical protein
MCRWRRRYDPSDAADDDDNNEITVVAVAVAAVAVVARHVCILYGVRAVRKNAMKDVTGAYRPYSALTSPRLMIIIGGGDSSSKQYQ